MEQSKETYWGMSVNTYCMVVHLSQLSSFVIPGLGLIVPVVMWLCNKDKNEEIDKHGKAAVNWIISVCIFSVVCFILTFIVVGAIGFMVLGLLDIIFAIVAAIKANKGEVWVYPLSIQILK